MHSDKSISLTRYELPKPALSPDLPALKGQNGQFGLVVVSHAGLRDFRLCLIQVGFSRWGLMWGSRATVQADSDDGSHALRSDFRKR
jgi:hypothetical protein